VKGPRTKERDRGMRNDKRRAGSPEYHFLFF